MTRRQGRVLIIGPSNIGDAILMSDVIAAVHESVSDAHLTLVVGERATALFVDDPRIHTLVNLDAYNSLVGRLKLLLALWRFQPHLLIDLRHTLYPLLLKPLRAWRYFWFPPRRLVHMRDRHWWKLTMQAPAIASAMAGRGPDEFRSRRNGSSVWLSERDEEHVKGLWRRWNLSQTQRLVIICPGARSHIKRWTAEGFAQVADRLIADHGAQVVFSGEPDEESVIESIREFMRQRAVSAVGLTTIRQLGVLMRRAQLVITNDSASLHLASALQVPTVAIFGPTDAAKYGPRAFQSRTVRRRLFCAPCEQPLCRFNHECMRFVAADEVFDAARDLLQQAISHKHQRRTT